MNKSDDTKKLYLLLRFASLQFLEGHSFGLQQLILFLKTIQIRLSGNFVVRGLPFHRCASFFLWLTVNHRDLVSCDFPLFFRYKILPLKVLNFLQRSPIVGLSICLLLDGHLLAAVELDARLPRNKRRIFP